MRPLEGIKVLDFSHAAAGPFATMLLADLGCQVIKIERPGRGDAVRYLNVSEKFNAGIPRIGGDYFLAINRNKWGITVDLEKEKGKQIALELAKWADVAVQSFRPGVMTKLKLDYPALRAVNPSLIYASLSAYGTSGPLAHQPGMDLAIQARSGVMSITGYPGSEPVKPGVSLSDFSGGVHLAVAILAALVHREKTGMGQEICLSLLDATMVMLSNYAVAVMDGNASIPPMGSGQPQIAPYQAFPTRDGFVVIATGTEKLYRDLCAVLAVPDLSTDIRFKTNPDRVKHRDELVALLSITTKQKTTAEWVALFEKNEIPCAPVNNLKSAFEDEQLKANEMVAEVEHPALGTLHMPGIPYKFSETSCRVFCPPPMLGEHTEHVLQSILGMSQEEIDTLKCEEVI